MSDLTPELVNGYFAGLLDGAPTRGRDDPFLPQYERFLSRMYCRRGEPGQLLFVLGTGRNGSTSMAHALRQLADGLVTHERPPLLHWYNPGPRLDFHTEFLRISREYFAVVGDVSHWWLPHIDALAEALGPVKVVYLHRGYSATVASFERVKLRVKPPFNHWLPHDGDAWTRDPWDGCYPNVLNEGVTLGPSEGERAKSVCRFCIEQYVKRYQSDARRLIRRHGGIELRLDTLFTPASGRLLARYLGHDFPWRPANLNRGGTEDSAVMPVFPREAPV